MVAGINCAFCGHHETRVREVRPAEDRGTVRRRRECLKCGERWTTLELEEDRVDLLEEVLRERRPGEGR
jgi:transcriptional regulator NrdR family protein